jgi:uncharacterized protein
VTSLQQLCRGILAVFLLFGASDACADEKKIAVLLVTGGHGFEVEPFFKIFSDNPEIAFTAAKHGKDADVYVRDDLLTYDVAVLYDMPRTITDEQKARFRGFLQKGKGLVVLHHALVSFPGWSDYEAIIGGGYSQADEKSGKAGYQHDVEIPVQIAAKDHPITRGLADFVIHDEIYWGFRVGRNVTPLLTTTQPKSGNPIAWVNPYEKNRVVYLQLGHGRTAYEHPQYRELVARSIRWAAGR